MEIARRQLLLGATAAAALAGGVIVPAAAQAPEPPGLSAVCDLHFELEPPLVIPGVPLGRRTVLRVRGGTVDGPRLTGRILPGNGDWALMRPDGMFELDVRAVIETADGAMIAVSYPGLVRMAPAAWARFQSGDKPGPEEYYFRVAPRFEAAAEPYLWLNRALFVGVGYDLPPTPKYRVWEVL